VKKSKEDTGRQIRRREEKEDPVEAELVSLIGREECVYKGEEEELQTEQDGNKPTS
jgi:hypothetical protein